jgi:hypothetical protein
LRSHQAFAWTADDTGTLGWDALARSVAMEVLPIDHWFWSNEAQVRLVAQKISQYLRPSEADSTPGINPAPPG